MLSFKGTLTAELITALLGLVERKLDLLEPQAQVRKRVFNVVMECLQNLFHHTRADEAEADEEGVVVIARTDMGFSVLTGNYMDPASVEQLRAHLDRVNALDPEGLRDLYKNKLADGRYSPVGGGGLGIIDIARRSGRKLEYGFVPHDARRTFFSLNVNVPS
ncbi:MAG: SiaB family protein kinase [Flavobacteriales bacterium]|nr:SiaB family protein kinase [Flavobacteriales bacterium]